MTVYGWILMNGGIIEMNSKIVEALELMCDRENPQDRKLLLLAELVETKCDALGEKIRMDSRKVLTIPTASWIS